jgi:hypothetical protein
MISHFGIDTPPLSQNPILYNKLLLQFWSMSKGRHTRYDMLANKKIWWILLGQLVALVILIQESKAQSPENKGLIYGKVITFDNQYEGLIRWEDEETFWFDHFNAAKLKNEAYEKLREEHRPVKSNDWSDFDWDFSSLWEDQYSHTVHQFACQFGDIAVIENIGRERINVILKNDMEIRLSGQGYNDVGATLIIEDNELGKIKVRWDRVEEVIFKEAPSHTHVKDRIPIYGKVETYRKGTFVGFIQWDSDERLAYEKLDGDSRNVDVSVAFDDIKYIEKDGNGCIVELNSGRDYYLTNSNDVDSDNRGLIMTIPDVGKIDIPWRYFRNVSLMTPPDFGPAYDDYPTPEGLFGTVYTVNEEKFSGKIIFDIDEAWELELLEGKDDGVEYQIPFRNIKSIVPKNYNFSMLELKNGDQILLGDGRDVSDDNDGLLVYARPDAKPEYIAWSKIAEIVFD